MGEHLNNLGNYAFRKGDQDTRVAENQAMVGKISSLFVEVGSALSFETPELLKIAPETLERFYQEEPGLETYRRYFQIVQDQKEHILSDAEEKLLAAAGEMAQAPDDIYGKLTNADLTFPDAVDGQGNAVPLSDGSFVPTQISEDRVLRGRTPSAPTTRPTAPSATPPPRCSPPRSSSCSSSPPPGSMTAPWPPPWPAPGCPPRCTTTSSTR